MLRPEHVKSKGAQGFGASALGFGFDVLKKLVFNFFHFSGSGA